MNFKRMMAFLLAVCLTATMLPAQAKAVGVDQTAVDNSNVSVEGTNGFGALLSAKITASQEC